MRLLLLIIFVFGTFCGCNLDLETKPVPITNQTIEWDKETGRYTPIPNDPRTPQPTPLPLVQETAVLPIPLAGDASDSNSEISGMAWYEDWLILLPQYPDFSAGSGDGRVFALSRDDILNFLSGETAGPLTPRSISFVAPGLKQNIAGFEGYEAITFVGDKAYLTVEASPSSGMIGYLLKGTMAKDLSGLIIDTNHIAEIKSATGLPNKSDETLLYYKDNILSIHEANGENVNPSPVANIFGLDLEPAGVLPLAAIEYRVTDATAVDAQGRFWIINYYFPGEQELFSRNDQIAETYGQGRTHSTRAGVERLVEFQIKNDRIALVNQPLIQLELLPDDLRNWEGIARLEGHGFLLVTDKFPQTILGFVPDS